MSAGQLVMFSDQRYVAIASTELASLFLKTSLGWIIKIWDQSKGLKKCGKVRNSDWSGRQYCFENWPTRPQQSKLEIFTPNSFSPIVYLFYFLWELTNTSSTILNWKFSVWQTIFYHFIFCNLLYSIHCNRK